MPHVKIYYIIKEIEMEDLKMIEEIKKELLSKLQAEFGYCGLAEDENFLMLNSGKGNIVINIKWE